MAGGPGPRLASVRIRRLVVRGAEAAPGLGDAIAAALVRELGADGAAEPPQAGVAQTIARAIVDRTDIAGRNRDGRR